MTTWGKQKPRDDTCHTCPECKQSTGVKLNGNIAVHRYNASMFFRVYGSILK